jgi:hypothetical protein
VSTLNQNIFGYGALSFQHQALRQYYPAIGQSIIGSQEILIPVLLKRIHEVWLEEIESTPEKSLWFVRHE